VKILDKYLLKTFITTFTSVFVILFFIFVLQVVWLFISELAGKDLEFIMILKFLLFKMPSIIPLVLPLSVVLASIMTFGSFAENYEFAAMKSSGISLQRSMKSLIIFISLLSVLAFLFSNNVIPYAEYKFINFRRNIAQVKPAMAIAEGQFSQVGAYNIKVEKKIGEEGRFLEGITIHKLSTMGPGSNTVIKAKKGELISNENSNVLKLVLKDGNYYEDIIPVKYEDRIKVPFAKSEFKTYIINIDLSKLNSSSLDEEQITNTNTMLTVGELKFTLDSLQKTYNRDAVSIAENMNFRSAITNSNLNPTSTTPKFTSLNILDNFKDANDKSQILRVASSTIDATNFSLDNSNFELNNKQININQHWIAFYDKFVIAFACLLMFFIGAPLGAIIRKGGLGLPIVFAILIFIIFHFINTFGKKVAQQNEISPFLGCWMSTLVLMPLAIFLTRRATNDRGITINFESVTNSYKWFLNTIKLKSNSKLFSLFKKSNSSEIVEMNIKSDVNYEYLKKLGSQYKKNSFIALLVYFILLLASFYGKPTSLIGTIIIITVSIIFYLAVVNAQVRLKKFTNEVKSKNDISMFIIVAAGFPFYILFFLYNNAMVNEILKQQKNNTF